MKRIYKYNIPITDVFTLSLPKGARVLAVQEQHGEPFIWCLVKNDAPREDRHFRLAGTGHPIEVLEADLYYIGTWQSLGGTLVWHLFEVLV